MFCSTGPPQAPTTSISGFTNQYVRTEKVPTGLLTNEPVFSVIVLGLVIFFSVITILLSFCIVYIRKEKEMAQPWSRRSVRQATVYANKENGKIKV